MWWVAGYFVVSFLLTCLMAASQSANPLPKPPAVSYQRLQLMQESRSACLFATLMAWPAVIAVYIVIGIVALANWLGSLLVKDE